VQARPAGFPGRAAIRQLEFSHRARSNHDGLGRRPGCANPDPAGQTSLRVHYRRADAPGFTPTRYEETVK
jgi:hypothetical protein